MEAGEGFVFVVGIVEVRDEVVIVLPVDQVVNGVGTILRHVHQKAHPICFFANVIVFSLEFLNVFGGEGDRLRPWEVEVMATDQVTYFVLKVSLKVIAGPDTTNLEEKRWVIMMRMWRRFVAVHGAGGGVSMERGFIDSVVVSTC